MMYGMDGILNDVSRSFPLLAQSSYVPENLLLRAGREPFRAKGIRPLQQANYGKCPPFTDGNVFVL